MLMIIIRTFIKSAIFKGKQISVTVIKFGGMEIEMLYYR